MCDKPEFCAPRSRHHTEMMFLRVLQPFRAPATSSVGRVDAVVELSPGLAVAWSFGRSCSCWIGCARAAAASRCGAWHKERPSVSPRYKRCLRVRNSMPVDAIHSFDNSVARTLQQRQDAGEACEHWEPKTAPGYSPELLLAGRNQSASVEHVLFRRSRLQRLVPEDRRNMQTTLTTPVGVF